MRSICCVLIFFIHLAALNSQTLITSPKYEFRGVWIATVNNIDWPGNKNLSTEAQKEEFISILNRQQKIVSDELVRVEQKGNVLQGVGFESDPNLKHYQFRTQVTGTVRSGVEKLIDSGKSEKTDADTNRKSDADTNRKADPDTNRKGGTDPAKGHP